MRISIDSMSKIGCRPGFNYILLTFLVRFQFLPVMYHLAVKYVENGLNYYQQTDVIDIHNFTVHQTLHRHKADKLQANHLATTKQDNKPIIIQLVPTMFCQQSNV